MISWIGARLVSRASIGAISRQGLHWIWRHWCIRTACQVRGCRHAGSHEASRIRRADRPGSHGHAARKRPSSNSSRATRVSATRRTSRAGRSCSRSAAVIASSNSARRSIDYTPEETRIWRDVSPKLDELHVKHACEIYLNAKRDLAITQRRDPAAPPSQRARPARNEHAPRPGRGCAAVPDLLRVHRPSAAFR